MRAARYHGAGDLRVEDVPRPDPDADEVLVEVAAAGVCGSDLHKYAWGPGRMPTDEPHPLTGQRVPLTMGHEFCGRVVETGDSADVERGTRVVVNPLLWCGSCRYCAAGEYNRCESGGFVGISGDGGFAEFAVVAGEQVVAMPDAVPFEAGALVEPFAVALHALRRSGLAAGDAVAVFGGGPIGLALAQWAALAGADVVVSEPRPARRDLAAAHASVVDPREEDPVAAVTAEGPVDCAFEVAGVEATVGQAIESTKRGGRVTVVSLFEDAVSVDLTSVVATERELVGTSAYAGGPRADEEFGRTLRAFERGALAPEALVTSRVGLGDVESGFERLLDDGSDDVKVLVEP